LASACLSLRPLPRVGCPPTDRLPPPPPSIYPVVAVESANSSRRRLRKPTPTPQYPRCPALTVLHNWLINGWMQTHVWGPAATRKPSQGGAPAKFFGGLFFINSTQSPAPSRLTVAHPSVLRGKKVQPGKAGVHTSLASVVAALRWQVREGGGGNHQSGRADPVGENQSLSDQSSTLKFVTWLCSSHQHCLTLPPPFRHRRSPLNQTID